jgi:hypothetical protein
LFRGFSKQDRRACFVLALGESGKARPAIEKDFVDKNGDAWLKRIESMK